MLVKHALDDTGNYMWIMCFRIGGECVERRGTSSLLWTFPRSTAPLVWTLVLITRGSTTQAGKLLHWFTSVRDMPSGTCGLWSVSYFLELNSNRGEAASSHEAFAEREDRGAA